MADGHIDAVADFVYNSENPEYNRDYKAWRKNTKAACAYRYTDNEKERSFSEGKTVARLSPAQAERQVLGYVAEVIGAALLILLVCDLAGGSLLVWLFQRLGFDIQLDFLTLSMRGNQWLIAAVRALVVLLKYGIPICILMRCFRLPTRVAAPVYFGAVPESVAAVGFAMICAAVYSLTADGSGVEAAQRIFSYKDAAAIIAYGLFDVLVAAVLAELLRGTMLPALRQFGDGFAVCVTAAAGFLFPNTLPDRISALLIGLASGYLLIRGGSFGNCVLLRAVYTALTYARLVLVYTQHSFTLSKYVLILLAAGAAALLFYAAIRRQKLPLANRHSALTTGRKLMAFAQTVTTLPWLAASALVLLMQTFY